MFFWKSPEKHCAIRRYDMFTTFKYTILRLVRNKANLFWILVFPIVLGCLFKVAFSNITASESFHTIPVAVVSDESTNAKAFSTMIDQLSSDDKDAMLNVTYCDKKKATKLLEQKKIDGIFYASDDVTLSVNADASDSSINQSILQVLLTQYDVNKDLVVRTLQEQPEKLQELTGSMYESIAPRKEVSLTSDNTDTYDQYFYNLIAMACLYTALGGIHLAIGNAANLSDLAARKTISPTTKLASIAGELAAYILFEFLLNLLAFVFIVKVLGIHMAQRPLLAVLTILVSTACSISFGMFLGCIGPKSEGGKTAMMFATVMPCCFLSGLMMGTMRMIVEQHIPWLNRINPAALISDCFYTLNNYDHLQRFTTDIVTLVIMAVIFCGISCLVTRRKTYASL